MHHDSAVRPLPRQIIGGTISRDAEPVPVSQYCTETLSEHPDQTLGCNRALVVSRSVSIQTSTDFVKTLTVRRCTGL